MNDPTTKFDDPNLKATLRRALDGRADAGLRARITGLVESHAAGSRPAHAHRRPFVRRLAVAAAVLVALGTTALVWRHHHDAAEQAEYLAANLPLFNALIAAVERPDSASGADSSAFDVADRDALRQALAAKLGRRVPVPDWRDRGWRLTGAAVGPVGGHPAAQLRYENAGRRILLASLPARAYTGHEGEEPEPYEYTLDRHAIAGFVRDGGLHCVVGDPSVAAQELANLKVD